MAPPATGGPNGPAAEPTSGVLLAGILEKRARWRKEWNQRFCIVRAKSLDYYLEPPAMMGEGPAGQGVAPNEQRRGSIALWGPAHAVEEPGRPWCISVGGELLSCGTRAEQLRWLETIGHVSARLLIESGYGHGMPTETKPGVPSDLQLVLVNGDEPPRLLPWGEARSATLPSAGSAATVLFVEGAGGGSAVALCRLPLYDPPSSTEPALFPVMTIGMEPTGLQLRVRVAGVDGGLDSGSAGLAGLDTSLLRGGPCACLCLALASALGGGPAGTVFFILAALLLLQLPTPAAGSGQMGCSRRVSFAAEELVSATGDPDAEGLPAAVRKSSSLGPDAPGGGCAAAALGSADVETWTGNPNWLGKWQLDKPRSQLYEPVMSDMGVNWGIRKLLDAGTSTLELRTTETHVVITLSMCGVTIVESVPIDGSWESKPVPRGSKMRGECRWRLASKADGRLRMVTEFPDSWGTLTDTLTVAQDCKSFSRQIARSEALFITRHFKKVSE